MTVNSYVQRLVARLGMPTVGATNPAPAHFAPPETPTPPVFDPFAEDGEVDDALAPPSAPVTVPQLAPPDPSVPIVALEARDGVPPVIDATVTEFVLLPPPPVAIAPPASVEIIANDSATLPQPPMPHLDVASTLPLLPTVTERLVHETLLPPVPPEPPAQHPAAPKAAEAAALPLDVVTRIIYEALTPPVANVVPPSLEPAVEADAPAGAPIAATPAPQITIGNIVVEIVHKPEKPERTRPPLPPRVARPPEAPAPRRGVPSKRGFGIGQI